MSTTTERRAEDQPQSQVRQDKPLSQTEGKNKDPKLMHVQQQVQSTQLKSATSALDQAKQKFGKTFQGRVAFCLMEGELVEIGVQASQIVFDHGQRLFFCCDNCKTNFHEHPYLFFKHPGDPMFADLPQLENCCFNCVCGQEEAVKDDTPTVCFKNGQRLFFHDYGCLAKFVRNPRSYEASISAGQKLLKFVSKEDKGPFFSATCPVTGKAIQLDQATPHVELKGGQRIFTCCPECPMQVVKQYNEMLFHAERDTFVHPPKPDAYGLLCECPVTGELVRVSDKTPRVLIKSGQAIYFKTQKAVEEFLSAPQSFSLSATVPSERASAQKLPAQQLSSSQQPGQQVQPLQQKESPFLAQQQQQQQQLPLSQQPSSQQQQLQQRESTHQRHDIKAPWRQTV